MRVIIQHKIMNSYGMAQSHVLRIGQPSPQIGHNR